MTQEIIQMARDSGMELYGLGKNRARFVHHLEAFAKLVAEAEREAIAQTVNDDRGLSDDDAIRLCRAIRARGEEAAVVANKARQLAHGEFYRKQA
jgi:hypothetical protein